MSIKISHTQARFLRRLSASPDGLPAGRVGWQYNASFEVLEKRKLVELVTTKTGASVWKILPAAERFL